MNISSPRPVVPPLDTKGITVIAVPPSEIPEIPTFPVPQGISQEMTKTTPSLYPSVDVKEKKIVPQLYAEERLHRKLIGVVHQINSEGIHRSEAEEVHIVDDPVDHHPTTVGKLHLLIGIRLTDETHLLHRTQVAGDTDSVHRISSGDYWVH